MNAFNAKLYLPFVIALSEGKNIECLQCGKWILLEKGVNFTYEPELYRIQAPKKKYRVLEYQSIDNGVCFPWIVTKDQHEKFWEQSPTFVRWLSDWVYYDG